MESSLDEVYPRRKVLSRPTLEEVKRKPSSCATPAPFTSSFYRDDHESLMKKKFPSGKLAFTCKGFPVYKFGIDKFLWMQLVEDRLTFTMGDFYLKMDGKTNTEQWALGEQHMVLSENNFMMLAGLQLSNKLQLVPCSAAPDNGESHSLKHLGDSIYFGWSSRNRTPLANIREYIFDKNSGDFKSLRSGIAMGKKNWDSFCQHIHDMTFLNCALELLEKRKNPKPALPPPDMTQVKQVLPFAMFERFDARLTNECKKCKDMSMLFQKPTIITDEHHCKYGTNKLELNYQMRTNILDDMVVPLRAMLLCLQPWGKEVTSLEDCMKFEVDWFLSVNDDDLIDAMKAIAKTQFRLNYDIVDTADVAEKLAKAAVSSQDTD